MVLTLYILKFNKKNIITILFSEYNVNQNIKPITLTIAQAILWVKNLTQYDWYMKLRRQMKNLQDDNAQLKLEHAKSIAAAGISY